MSEKLWMPDLIRTELAKVDEEDDERGAKKRGRKFKWKLLFGDHHESHAASAFYPSPFDEAAILTIDGVGEWATSSIGTGKGNELTLLRELRYPNSVGLLYSAFTYYTGFKVNSGEYKVMGLAPYGEPKFVGAIKDHLLEVKEDGSIRLNQHYFNYSQGLRMTNGAFDKLFGGPPRRPESTITQREMDLARSIQVITEEVILKMARYARKETGMKYLCLAGGVALNCVANGRVLREVPFEDVWIQPAAGDAGGSLGVALAIWHRYLGKPRQASGGRDAMKGSYLGPCDSEAQIEKYLRENNVHYTKYEREQLPDVIAELLAQGKVIGLHQGRMEFGPRALGCRSIIGDARLPQMQSVMNLKIKFRESFRPFAPSVLREYASEWFELEVDSPYMSLVAQVKRLEIPAVTHVDGSARVQTVTRETNPLYWEIIEAFRKLTGCPVIVNTSFNVRGEPIVCTPEDSIRCFMRTEMDYLGLETFVLSKEGFTQRHEV
jgi:carbamoyltransferase